MRLLIDDSNIESISALYKLGIFSGITTNPTIIKKSGLPPLELIKNLLNSFSGLLFVQCVSSETKEIIQEGEKLYSLNPDRIVLKIPFSKNGLLAAEHFVEKSIPVTITAIYSFSQVILSSMINVDFVAPYLNRMQNVGIDVSIINKMQTYLENSNTKTKLIVASIKNLEQFEKIASYNVDFITASSDIYNEIFKNNLTKSATEQFNNDWENIKSKSWVI